MKKAIYFFAIALIGISVLIGCKPKNPVEDPNKGTDDTTTTTTPVDTDTVVVPAAKGFKFTVSDLTYSSVTVTVTADDANTPFYWDRLTIDQKDYVATAADVDATIQEMIEYYAMFGYEITVEDILVAQEDAYSYSATPNTEYIVWAAYYDEATGKFTDPVVFSEPFTTPALPEPVPSDNQFTVEYNGDSLLNITTTNADDYYVEVMDVEFYNEYIGSGMYTEAQYLEESIGYYTEYNEEYAPYYLFSGNYEYNFWADYGRQLEAGEYYALVAGVSNFQVSTPVTKIQFTLPDLGVDNGGDDVVDLAPAKVRALVKQRMSKQFVPQIKKAARK